MSIPVTPVVDRFWAKVRKTESCWFWAGSTKSTRGYGMLWIGGGKSRHPYRFSFELHKGAVPTGLQVDHLCRNRACVNPDHLEAVTPKENVLRGSGLSAQNARKTHCRNNHPFDLANTLHYRGQRHCRTCKSNNQKRRRLLLRKKRV